MAVRHGELLHRGDVGLGGERDGVVVTGSSIMKLRNTMIIERKEKTSFDIKLLRRQLFLR